MRYHLNIVFHMMQMKLFIDVQDFAFSSELILLYGLLQTTIQEPSHCYNFQGVSRYEGLQSFCEENITYVGTVEDCDVIVLPYKFKGVKDPVFQKYNTTSICHKKPLWCFFNDDSDKVFDLPPHVCLYRTSFYGKTKLPNEYPLIAFSPDYFRGIFQKENLDSIGYCGHIMHGRKHYLQTLLKSQLKCDFVLRRGFWAPGIDKQVARQEYFQNMENNVFTFCYRGAGNFSYRLYETFMMGRIPIFVNTDCVLPFWDQWKHLNVGLFIDENEVRGNEDKWVEMIRTYIESNQNSLLDIQQQNRKLWETYFSPCGFLRETLRSFTPP